MALKLYEENNIKAIADAIRGKKETDTTYKVSEMADAVKTIASGTHYDTLKVYEGEVVSNVIGKGEYVVLAKDEFLKNMRADDSLFIRVHFLSAKDYKYACVRTWSQNTLHLFLHDTTIGLQRTVKTNGSLVTYYNEINHNIIDATDLTTSGVGRLYITEDGELRCYSNSTTYSVVPSKYTIIVEWGECR